MKMLYGGTIHKMPKYQNCLHKTHDTSVLQKSQNHQRPPDGTQRQRSYNQEEWCHLQIQM